MLKSLRKSTVFGLVALGIAFSSVAWFQQSDLGASALNPNFDQIIAEDDYNGNGG